MSSIVGRSVEECQTHRQPALLNFRIRVSSSGIISVNSFKESNSNLVNVFQKSSVEDNFQVAVESEVILVVGGACFTLELNVSESKAGSFSGLGC